MKEIYITTPIYYVNDKPHIGHAYTSIICDVLSRFYRLKNYKVIFLTGTDEHGQKVENAAKKKNINPKQFVDNVSYNFKELARILNISNTDFIRTTESRHKKTVEYIWKKLVDNKQIYIDKYEGWYSIKDETFYQEKELKKDNNNFYTTDNEKVEWVKEESYFFKLSNWQDNLLSFYNENLDFVKPISRRNEVLSFIKSGLKDLSVSRTSFNWGIKVPGNDKHVIYVWIDALTNYLSAIDYPNSKNNKNIWNNSIHIIGKDILKFHAVYWPAILMAIGLNPPKLIFAHGWWTNEGQKISKSLNNTIDPISLIDKFGLDQLRYFFVREVPLGQDGDYSEKSFINRINADLANSFGNLIQRSLKMVNKNFDNKMPYDLSNYTNQKVLESGYTLLSQVEEKVNKFEYHKALEQIWAYIIELNQFIDEEKPWITIKNDRESSAKTLSILIESFRLLGLILLPFIPDSANKLLNMLNIDKNKRNFNYFKKDFYVKKGEKMNAPEPIFPRFQ